MGEIKSIPTFYDGILYRSRLEARWALFFKTLGFEFDYEPEGVVCDGLCYLVDFWLPRVKMFAEVKPTWLTPEEDQKLKLMVMFSGKPCLVLDGKPDFRPYTAMHDYVLNGSHEIWECDYVLDPELYHTEGRFFSDPTPPDFTKINYFSDDYINAAYDAWTERFDGAMAIKRKGGARG